MTVVTASNFEQCRAAYGDEYLADHGCARFVTCECCGGLGVVPVSVVVSKWADPTDAYGEEQCSECEGSGAMCVMTEAVTMEDLDGSVSERAHPHDNQR